MNKIDLLFGTIIGFLSTLLGSYLFLKIFTSYDFRYAIEVMISEGYLGKLIALGAILNIGIYFLLLKLNKELMAQGVILGTIILAIITLFLQK